MSISNGWVYDIETFPNVFTIAFENAASDLKFAFEISPWRNDSREIVHFCSVLRESGARMVGFNNLGFDYPILHLLIRTGFTTASVLYEKAQAIINSQNDEGDDSARWAHQIRPSGRIVEQIDLFKIHHFDNRARSTSLKMLEFNMRAPSIQELPFKVGTVLDHDEVQVLKSYNAYDVAQTKAFYLKSLEMIAFREELVNKYQGFDWINFNDTKIGKQYFAMELEKAGVQLYDFGPDGRTHGSVTNEVIGSDDETAIIVQLYDFALAGRKPRQTKRPQIHLRDAVLPWIKFDHPEFTRILNWFKEQTITETKGVFDNVSAVVDGFQFDFGTGGIHGSVTNEVIEADDETAIIDLDVKSFYPNLAIVNRFYPEHLGEKFCDIYQHLYEMRATSKKGSSINAMLKLALNGVYGDSNSQFSVFYDPLFTMKITINGQLLLCILAEKLMKVSGLRLVQINTDGLTIHVSRDQVDHVNAIAEVWEKLTGLTLEEVEYSKMCIRDVNNYVAQTTKGDVKRKGAYEYEMDWHQNHGALVVPKVAEKVLLEGAPIRETVEQWPDIMDFMLRTKVPRSSYLAMELDGQTTQQQNITRYYVAKGGGRLFKWMPPLKGKQEWRRIGVESGWGVQVCNTLGEPGLPIDFDYYVREVEKLCLPLL